ncbi:MAG: recombination mediator RecR [Verrucomicrobiales bacterium]
MKKIEYPEQVKNLILHLKRLPGIGPRSAERITLWFLERGGGEMEALSQALVSASAEVDSCEVCGFFATASGCAICGDDERERAVLCIVEEPADILPLERTGAYRGQYHSLGGKISPLDNVGPEDLNLKSLWARLERGGFREVILAVGSDVEGEATANYLGGFLEKHGVSVTRLAQGLPAGGGLEHADELTLLRALEGRRPVRRD